MTTTVNRQVRPTLITSMGSSSQHLHKVNISWPGSSTTSKTYPAHIRNMLESAMNPKIHVAEILIALASSAIILLSARLLTPKTHDRFGYFAFTHYSKSTLHEFHNDCVGLKHSFLRQMKDILFSRQ
uniref:Uncharacterized protein n=1 Tax=Candidatus Kentrum sp. TC TaxID=2126339 RepID=A0A450YBN9_9GAMM|nr:MAG: hypothetical protein BECKTC1821E_GA0114239_100327 [Candidatus Kentron sp. TC]